MRLKNIKALQLSEKEVICQELMDISPFVSMLPSERSDRAINNGPYLDGNCLFRSECLTI